MHGSTYIKEPSDVQDPAFDVLEEGLLHKVLVFFHLPHRWPGLVVLAAGVGLAAAAAVTWQFARGSTRLSLGIFVMLAFFLVLDGMMLHALPKYGLSFGPWKSQLAALTVPRWLAAVACAFGTVPIGNRPGFVLLAVLQLVGTAALAWGAFAEPFRLRMTELLTFTRRLPVGLPPLRILHITDMHIERWTKREDGVLALAAAAQPDLIVITGDYVNTSYNKDPETHRLVRQFLARLSAPYGVYATLGSPPVDLREEVLPLFEGLDVTLLRNDWRQIDLADGRSVVLLGMDCTHHIPTDAARLAHLVSKAPYHLPQVLLYHSPELMPQAVAFGIDLYLCGHTHGGQVRLPLVGPLLTSSRLGRRYVMGHYRNGRTHLYVSRGVGLEGMSAPRVRFMAPPEVTLVMLTPGGDPANGRIS